MNNFLLFTLTLSVQFAHAESLGSSESTVFGGSTSQPRIMQLLGSTPVKDGPNCFNAAAFVRGFVDHNFTYRLF